MSFGLLSRRQAEVLTAERFCQLLAEHGYQVLAAEETGSPREWDGLSLAILALCLALINKSLRGGLVIVGGLNLGGSIDPLPNAIDMVELPWKGGVSDLDARVLT